MGSRRLPGKTLRSLCGRSVLAHVVARVRSARRLSGVMVATARRTEDDAIVAVCGELAVPVFRGSESDVLSRYLGAARAAGAETVVRVTADCPFFDGELLDMMLAEFHQANRESIQVDYLSNVLRRTHPRGLDAEALTTVALETAGNEASAPHEREHVTPYIYQHPERFRLRSHEATRDLSGLRWTLDVPEDWSFAEAVYRALHRPDRSFTTAQLLELLEQQPELAEINAHVEQSPLPGRGGTHDRGGA